MDLSGFTLIELTVVIAILGTLSSLAIPAYSSCRNRTKERMAIVDIRAPKKHILTFQAGSGAQARLRNSKSKVSRAFLRTG